MGSLVIITQFRDAIEAARFRDVATGAELRLRRADNSRPIAEQSMMGVDRRFQIEIVGGRNRRQLFGDGYTTIHFDLVVIVGYFRGGGDAAGGDLVSVNKQAGDDQALIADALLDSRNWNADATDIQDVVSVNWFRSASTKLNEYWTGALTVEQRVPWLPA